MDHHCPWINSCVGHANHASFVRFLFFVPFGCIHGVILNANFIYRLLDYVSLSVARNYMLCFVDCGYGRGEMSVYEREGGSPCLCARLLRGLFPKGGEILSWGISAPPPHQGGISGWLAVPPPLIKGAPPPSSSLNKASPAWSIMCNHFFRDFIVPY